MKVTAKMKYGIGEIRIGNSSWSSSEQSVKWAYPDKRGLTSLRSPEVPVDVLIEMVIFANNEKIINKDLLQKLIKELI